MQELIEPLSWAAIGSGLVSAGCWLRASVVKISREQLVEQKTRQAAASGVTPNLAGVSLDGWDMSATFSAQAKWNAFGAFAAAAAILFQTIALICERVSNV